MVFLTQIFSTTSTSLNKRITVGLTAWTTRSELFRALFLLLIYLVMMASCDQKEAADPIVEDYVQFDLRTDHQFQVIHNFGASDAWSSQFVGNWPDQKRAQIAQWLFSLENNTDGTPKGIGLSAWRFNIGAGSAEQGSSSDIPDEWRRAQCFLSADGSFNWAKQSGQQWFVNQASTYGVGDIIGFVNSPPVHYTNNGKAYSSGGSNTNLTTNHFADYADFLVEVLKHFESRGLEFDYISPFNEPQWDWDNPTQEGSPWLNDEVAEFTRLFHDKLLESGLSTHIELPETAQANYLYEEDNKPGRGNQIESFFDQSSEYYLGDLELVASKVAGHSYYTTWNPGNMIDVRKKVHDKLSSVDPNLEYWMTEYCVLEDNTEINGNGRDLGIVTALYMARVIHTDLTVANASAWQWWLAISPYDYKDGLVYVEKNQSDGYIQDSKTLWAFGNYSRFIRPGATRIGVIRSDSSAIQDHVEGLMTSSYINLDGKTVTVVINYSIEDQAIKLSKAEKNVTCTWYLTNAKVENNLKNQGTISFDDALILPARSISTFVEN